MNNLKLELSKKIDGLNESINKMMDYIETELVIDSSDTLLECFENGYTFITKDAAYQVSTDMDGEYVISEGMYSPADAIDWIQLAKEKESKAWDQIEQFCEGVDLNELTPLIASDILFLSGHNDSGCYDYCQRKIEVLDRLFDSNFQALEDLHLVGLSELDI